MELYIILGVLFIWLIVLTWIILRVRSHYRALIYKSKRGTIDSILEKLLKDGERSFKEIDLVRKELEGLEHKEKFSIKRVGLVRFSPFERMSGDQSFVVSLLNEEKSGLVLNFIYTREGIRVYAKKIKNGKGEKFELSKEECKAIRQSI